MTTWHHGELPTQGHPPTLGIFGYILSSHVVASASERTQHVFYGSTDGNIYELWWQGGEPARLGKLAIGSPMLTSHFNPVEGFQHVFHTVGDHIWEIAWTGGGPIQQGDLMTDSNPKLLATGALPRSHVTFDGSQHVFYRTPTGHIAELSWSGGASATQRDLIIAQNGVAPLATGHPASYVAADGTQHVFYEASGHIIELSWQGSSGTPVWRDLTMQSPNAPLAIGQAGPLATHFFAAEGTQHVFYVDEQRNLIELWWQGEEVPHNENLNKRSGTLVSLGFSPVSHVFDAEGTQHVYHVADDGNIIELWWRTGGPKTLERLNDRSGTTALPAGGLRNPVSHVFNSERTQHLFFASNDGRITELWSQP